MPALRLLVFGYGHVRSGNPPSLLRASGQESPATPNPGNDEVFDVIKKLKQRFHGLRLDFSLSAPRVAVCLTSSILLSDKEIWNPMQHKLVDPENTGYCQAEPWVDHHPNSFSRFAIALMCSGPIRQQPPTTVAPAATHSSAADAQSSGDTVPNQALFATS